jgi:hypothetical protein
MKYRQLCQFYHLFVNLLAGLSLLQGRATFTSWGTLNLLHAERRHLANDSSPSELAGITINNSAAMCDGPDGCNGVRLMCMVQPDFQSE